MGLLGEMWRVIQRNNYERGIALPGWLYWSRLAAKGEWQ